MTEKLFLLTLMDLETWQWQKLWVRTPCPHGHEEITHDWQAWINEGGFDPPLTVQNPSVIRVQEFLGNLIPEGIARQ